MGRSQARFAAIGPIIACGLLAGGIGGLGLGSAAADPGPTPDTAAVGPATDPDPGGKPDPDTPAEHQPDKPPDDGSEGPGEHPDDPCDGDDDDDDDGGLGVPAVGGGGGGGGGGGVQWDGDHEWTRPSLLPGPSAADQKPDQAADDQTSDDQADDLADIGTGSGGGGGVNPPGPALAMPPIALPPLVIAPPPANAAVGDRPPTSMPAPLPSAPAAVPGTAPAITAPIPMRTGPGAPPAGIRLGYAPYLQEADTGRIAALALPGVAGIIALTAVGGLVGYRQAKSGLAVRAAGTSRFLP